MTWRTIALGSLLALATAGAPTASHGGDGAARVAIHEFHFEPARVTIPVGGTVTWSNADEEAHTVTASDRSYSSEGLEQAEVYTHRFTAPGTYQYFCALHPHMTATVVVQ